MSSGRPYGQVEEDEVQELRDQVKVLRALVDRMTPVFEHFKREIAEDKLDKPRYPRAHAEEPELEQDEKREQDSMKRRD